MPGSHISVRNELGMHKMVQEKTLVLNGKKVHYLEDGRGEPILLIHGWFGSSNGFIYVLPKLAKKYHVIAPDLPGFGLRTKDGSWFSEDLDCPHTISAYVDFLNSFIEKKDFSRINLVGVSMGGILALEFAKKYPKKILNVVIHEPTLGGEEIFILLRIVGRISQIFWTRKTIRWFVKWATKLDKLVNKSRLSKEDQRLMVDELYGGSLRAASESAQDLIKGVDPQGYKVIKTKVLIIYGNLKNPFLSLKTIEKLKFNMPQAKVIKISSVSHDFIREDPGEFSKLVMDFLEK